MKTAIGGTQLFVIVIVLLLLFTGYMCLSINYTAAYKVADSVVLQIQKDDGVDNEKIAKVLNETKYYSNGDCGTGWTAMVSSGVSSSSNGNYCLKKVKVAEATNELPEIYYYQVKVFFNVDAPFFSRFAFQVKGDTANIYSPNDNVSGGNIIVVSE